MTEGPLIRGRLWDPRDPRWERWVAGSGIVFVFLAVLAYLVAPGLPHVNESDVEVEEWFVDNESRVRWQVFLFGLATIFFLWFYATLARRLRSPHGQERLPSLIVASAGASAALYLVATACFGALARLPSDGQRALFELGNMVLAVNEFVAVTLIAAASIAILRTRALPEWLAWAGGVFVVLGLLDSAGRILADSGAFGAGSVFGTLAFLVFLAWTLAASIVLWQATPVEPVTHVQEPAAPPPPPET